MARTDGRQFFVATTRAKGRTDSFRVATLTDPDTGAVGIYPRDYFTTSSARKARIAAEALNNDVAFDQIDANPTERALAEMTPQITSITVNYAAYAGGNKIPLFQRSSFEGDPLDQAAIDQANAFADNLAANVPSGRVVVTTVAANGAVNSHQVAADGARAAYA